MWVNLQLKSHNGTLSRYQTDSVTDVSSSPTFIINISFVRSSNKICIVPKRNDVIVTHSLYPCERRDGSVGGERGGVVGGILQRYTSFSHSNRLAKGGYSTDIVRSMDN